MRILVSAGSRHGSTAQIATVIAQTLVRTGHDVDVVAPEAVDDLGAYDAVVLGSAVYGGRWTGAAKGLALRCRHQFLQRPVWVFSSGPLGDPPVPAAPAADVEQVLRWTNAVEHRTFAGRLDRGRLGLAERAVVTAVRAPAGDYRDWGAIQAWAHGIGEQLGVPATIG